MRITTFLALVGVVVLSVGCAGPERKLGRGMANVTEFLRGGESRRAIEQTALWDSSDVAFTTGFIRGFNRSVVRTAIGAYEIVTFPLPGYGPHLSSPDRVYPDMSVRNKSYPYGGMVLTEYPAYPDNYRPGVPSGSMFDTDTSLGFSGGDVAPSVPGSRFRIFDN